MDTVWRSLLLAVACRSISLDDNLAAESISCSSDVVIAIQTDSRGAMKNNAGHHE